jgi:2-iminobutanoate/2-iminopropanoate deaminase
VPACLITATMVHMKQQVITSNTASDHILSQGIISNGLIFVSGQIHAKPDLTLVEGTTEEKVTQIMANISDVLKEADATLNDVVKVVIYVTDMSIMPELNKVYPAYFQKPLPVREAVCVAGLPLGASIEISVIAAR